MEEKEFYNKLLAKFGIIVQIGVAIEELAELIIVLSNINDNIQENKAVINNLPNLCSEIADVKICTEQIMLYYDIEDKIKRKRVFRGKWNPIEASAKLICSLSKIRRNLDISEEISDFLPTLCADIADIQNCIDSITSLFGLEEKIKQEKRKKIERTEKRLLF